MEDGLKKLYRSDNEKMICGVCGGIAEYFNVDPTLIRLLWVVLTFSGPGLLAYFIAAIIIPRRID
jgi:phage shock protein PspC (stress-responsive transcriptional regulator)